MKSRVTYIICNSNYGHYLRDCLSSAIQQTYSPLQICVIDDGSTDNSWNVIQGIFVDPKQQQVDDILILSEIFDDRKHTAIKIPNRHGPSYARNIGIDLTLPETDYYAILDADDENYPDKIEKCVAILDSDPNIGLVYADYDILNVNTGNTIREYKKPYDKHQLMQECIVHSGSVIRKNTLLQAKDQYGYYDVTLRLCEDWETWLRMSDFCTMYHLAEPLSLVRSHNQDSSHSESQALWQQCWQYVANKTKRRYEENKKHR